MIKFKKYVALAMTSVMLLGNMSLTSMAAAKAEVTVSEEEQLIVETENLQNAEAYSCQVLLGNESLLLRESTYCIISLYDSDESKVDLSEFDVRLSVSNEGFEITSEVDETGSFYITNNPYKDTVSADISISIYGADGVKVAEKTVTLYSVDHKYLISDTNSVVNDVKLDEEITINPTVHRRVYDIESDKLDDNDEEINEISFDFGDSIQFYSKGEPITSGVPYKPDELVAALKLARDTIVDATIYLKNGDAVHQKYYFYPSSEYSINSNCVDVNETLVFSGDELTGTISYDAPDGTVQTIEIYYKAEGENVYLPENVDEYITVDSDGNFTVDTAKIAEVIFKDNEARDIEIYINNKLEYAGNVNEANMSFILLDDTITCYWESTDIEIFADSQFWYSGYLQAVEFSKEFPYGNNLDNYYKVTNIEAINAKPGQFEAEYSDEDECWYLYFNIAGDIDYEVTCEDPDGNEIKKVHHASVIDVKYAIETSITGEEIAMCKGESLDFEYSMISKIISGNEKLSAPTYYIKADDEATDAEVSLEIFENSFTVTLSKDCNLENDTYSFGLVLCDIDGNELAKEKFDIKAKDEYFEIKDANGFYKKVFNGRYLNIKPELWRHFYDEEEQKVVKSKVDINEIRINSRYDDITIPYVLDGSEFSDSEWHDCTNESELKVLLKDVASLDFSLELKNADDKQAAHDYSIWRISYIDVELGEFDSVAFLGDKIEIPYTADYGLEEFDATIEFENTKTGGVFLLKQEDGSVAISDGKIVIDTEAIKAADSAFDDSRMNSYQLILNIFDGDENIGTCNFLLSVCVEGIHIDQWPEICDYMIKDEVLWDRRIDSYIGSREECDLIYQQLVGSLDSIKNSKGEEVLDKVLSSSDDIVYRLIFDEPDTYTAYYSCENVLDADAPLVHQSTFTIRNEVFDIETKSQYGIFNKETLSFDLKTRRAYFNNELSYVDVEYVDDVTYDFTLMGGEYEQSNFNAIETDDGYSITVDNLNPDYYEMKVTALKNDVELSSHIIEIQVYPDDGFWDAECDNSIYAVKNTTFEFEVPKLYRCVYDSINNIRVRTFNENHEGIYVRLYSEFDGCELRYNGELLSRESDGIPCKPGVKVACKTLTSLDYDYIYFSIYKLQDDDGYTVEDTICNGSFTLRMDYSHITPIAENTAKGIKLSWKDSASNTLSYSIYRKASNEKNYKLIGNTNTTNYTDSKAIYGNTYSYIIRRNLAESDDEKIVNQYIDNTVGTTFTYLATPTLKKIENTSTGLKLTWSKVSGAAGYVIYSVGSKNKLSKIATVKGNSTVTYIDKNAKNGKAYKYTVKAYKNTSYSLNSTKYLSYYRLSGVSSLALKNPKKSTLGISWKANASASGYEIKLSKNKKFTKGVVTKDVKKGNTKTVSIGKLKKGATYFVKIRDYKYSGKSKQYSVWSGVKSLKLKK